MNYGQLKTAILGDSHRENYTADIARFVSEGEGLIATKLDGYILTDTLTDIDRVDNLYVVGSGITTMRHVYCERQLTQVDENTADCYKNLSSVRMYCMRDTTLFLAGNPALGSSVKIEYYGMPAPLAADADTNSLLNEYPQLYRWAAQVSVFQKSQNWMAAKEMEGNVTKLIADINRRTRKRLGGSQSAPPYNTTFRSSY